MEELPNDLSRYSPIESCYWLMGNIYTGEIKDNPYIVPYCNYLATWPQAVPLKAIVIGQSPYPNNIFPPIAAAMSYDDELCSKVMKKYAPPTVQVLANDLFINAGVDKAITVQCIKDGWKLVDKGILLVNESILGDWSPSRAYKNSVEQIYVLVRLLRETEKYGKSKVHVFAMGNRSEIVLNNLSSWFKSDIVTIAKHKAPHPAGLSYRFSDLNDANCHMNTPAFSRWFAEIVSNQVAYKHTMARKQSEEEARIRLMLNTIQSLGAQIDPAVDDLKVFTENLRYIEMNTSVKSDEYKEALAKTIESATTLAARMSIVASGFRTIDASGKSFGVIGQVAKAGPSLLSTVSPTASAIESHVGKSPTIAETLPPKSAKITIVRRSGSKPSTMPSSQPESVPSAPTTPSIADSTTSTPRSSKVIVRRTGTTPIKQPTFSTPATPTPTNASQLTSTPASSNAIKIKRSTPRVTELPHGDGSMINIASREAYAKENKGDSLTKEMIDSLSSLDTILELNGVDISELDADDNAVILSGQVTKDVQSRIAAHQITKDLVGCIIIDTKNDAKFNLIQYAVDSKSCTTIARIKEYFEVNN